MSHRRARVAVAVVLLVACSGSSSSAPATVSADQACTDSAHARCTRYQTCSATALAELYGDEPTCETRVKASCLNALGAPGNANTPTQTQSCVQALGGWACNDFLAGANAPSACAQQTGATANGASCSAAGQCQSGFCAHTTSACGACQAAPTAGQPCTPSDQCAPGLACATNKTCVVVSLTGAPCSATQPCLIGLRCGTTGTCVAIDSTAAVGQPCGAVGGKNVACVSGTCEKGACLPRTGDGAACDLTNGPFCEPRALCVGGKCAVPACP